MTNNISHFSKLHDRWTPEDLWDEVYLRVRAMPFAVSIEMFRSGRYKRFIQIYLERFNATRAAEAAGFVGSTDAVFATTGCEMLRTAEVRGCIDKRLEEERLSMDEALHLLSQQTKASIDDFYTIDSLGKPQLNLSRAKRRGVLHLIKAIKPNPFGGWDVILHDAQAAAALIGRHYGAFKDVTEHRGAIRFGDVGLTDQERRDEINRVLELPAKAVS